MKRDVCQFASAVSINHVDCLAFLTETRFCWLPIAAPSAARSAALVVLASSTAALTSSYALQKINLAALDSEDVNSIDLTDLIQVTAGRRLDASVYSAWRPTLETSDQTAPTRTPVRASSCPTQFVEQSNDQQSVITLDETIDQLGRTSPTNQYRATGIENGSAPALTNSSGYRESSPDSKKVKVAANDNRYFCLFSIARRDIDLRLSRLRVRCFDEALANEWVVAVRRALARVAEVQRRPRKLICFVHPTSGRGLGKQLYQKVYPYFLLAGIEVKSVLTRRSNEAFETIMLEDVSQFDGILCVGGDGTLSEIMRAVLLRARYDANLPINADAFINCESDRLRSYCGSQFEHGLNSIEIPARVPIGVIPAGSTDATAYSLHGTNDAITCALHVIRGNRLPVDVSTMYRGSRFVRYCLNSCSYGFLGDVIASAEQLRHFGPLRYDLLAIAAWFRNDSYPVELEVVVAPDSTATATATCACSVSQADSSSVSASSNGTECKSEPNLHQTDANVAADPQPNDKHQRKSSRKNKNAPPTLRPCYSDCSVCRCACALRPSKLLETSASTTCLNFNTDAPALNATTSTNGTNAGAQASSSSSCCCSGIKQPQRLRFTGSFLSITISSLTCRNEKARVGAAPLVHHGDGVAQVTLLHRCSRFDIIRFFSRLTAIDSEVSPMSCMRHAMLSTSAFTSWVNSFNRRISNLVSDFDFSEAYRITELRMRPTVKRRRLREMAVAEQAVDITQESDLLVTSSTSQYGGTTTDSMTKGHPCEHHNAETSHQANAERSTGSSATSSNKRSKPAGRWNCDGELVDQDESEWTTVRVNRQMVQVFSDGIPSPESLRVLRVDAQKRAATNNLRNRCLPKTFRFDRVQLQTEKFIDSVAICCVAGPKVNRRVKQYEAANAVTLRRGRTQAGRAANSSAGGETSSRNTIESAVEVTADDEVITAEPRETFSVLDPPSDAEERTTDCSASDSDRLSAVVNDNCTIDPINQS